LVESLFLSLTGGLAGLALAYFMSGAMLHVAWTGLVNTPLNAHPDLRVIAFTAAVAVATGLLFALAPAWWAAQTDPLDALKNQTRSVRSGSTSLARAFCIAQISLSLMLVAGALLFGQTLKALHTADVGYRRDHLLTLLLFPQAGNRHLNDSIAYYKELAERLRRLPGVSAVSFSASGPANELDYFDPVQSSATQTSAQAVGDLVGPDFFTVAGMHVLGGREFNWRDPERKGDIVIVSQDLAERLFGHENPIGRTLFIGLLAYRNLATIVGEVNNASLWKVETPAPLAYFRPITQTWGDADPLVDIRTSVDPRLLKAAAEQTIRSLGRHYSLRTMTVEERLDSYITAQRLTAMLAAFFGGVALLVAAIGLYGLMSFQVTRRTAEMGVRVALGARRQDVVSLVLREALLLGGIGCAVGLVLSFAMGQLIRNLLFGTSGSNPAILAAAAGTLLFVTFLASSIPALRAASLDPVKALRVE
jgi:macrolide transport system ATP-binding/permease protein